MKRVLSFILALILLLSTAQVAFAAGEWSGWTTDSSKTADKNYEYRTKTQISTRTMETTTSSNSSLEGWTYYDYDVYVDWQDEIYYYDTQQTEYVNFTYVGTRQVATGTQTYLYRYYSPTYNDFSTWQKDGTYVVDGKWVSSSSCYPYDIYGTGQALYMSDEIKNYGSDYPCWKGETRTTYKTQYGYKYGEAYFTYYFYRYTDWSEWTDGTGAESDTLRVRTLYSYRLKDPDLHTVTYNYSKNGGKSASVKTASVRKGKAVSLKPTAKKSGWTFVGWNTDPKAKTALKSLKMGDKNIMLYAIYKKKITARFVDYKGKSKVTRTKSTVIYNSAKTATFNAPKQNTCTGWVTKGWAASKSNEAKKVKSFSLSSDKTYYGLYGKKVTVKYVADKGKTTPKTQTAYRIFNSSNKKNIKDPVVALAGKIKNKNENYSFNKWAYASTSGTKYDAGARIILKQDIKMYATWKLSNYYNLGEETYGFPNFDECSCGQTYGGHCFGMVMTSAAYYQGILNVKKGLGISTVKKINKVPNDATARRNICYYHNIQGSTADYAIVAGGSLEKGGYYEYRANVSDDWSRVVRYLSDGRNNKLGKMEIGLYGYYYDKNNTRRFGGHSLAFLYYKKVDGQSRIYVYDPNCPGTPCYFYKDSYGRVRESPFESIDASVISMSVASVSKYFTAAKKYKGTKAIYAQAGQIEIAGVKGKPMKGLTGGEPMLMYELGDDARTAVITPLVENARFTYCDETYSIVSPSTRKMAFRAGESNTLTAGFDGCVLFTLKP